MYTKTDVRYSALEELFNAIRSQRETAYGACEAGLRRFGRRKGRGREVEGEGFGRVGLGLGGSGLLGWSVGGSVRDGVRRERGRAYLSLDAEKKSFTLP